MLLVGRYARSAAIDMSRPHIGRTNIGHQGSVSRKSRELFGPEKPVVRLRSAYSVKLVFSYVVKGIKIKISAKFRASQRRLRFEDTKIIMSPEIRPKSFGKLDFRETGPRSFMICLYLNLVAVCEADYNKLYERQGFYHHFSF